MIKSPSKPNEMNEENTKVCSLPKEGYYSIDTGIIPPSTKLSYYSKESILFEAKLVECLEKFVSPLIQPFGNKLKFDEKRKKAKREFYRIREQEVMEKNG